VTERRFQTVAIVGVGLIGASFGLALRRAGFRGRILGVSSPAAAEEGLRRGAIDEAKPLAEAAQQADLLLLAQPICRILDTLGSLDAWLQPHCLVTDAGSTKLRIVERARRSIQRAQFLGGHPMAGKEKRGAAEAEADLFAGRTWILTPSDPRELQTAAARELLHWIRDMGAVPLIMSPEEHDRVVAFTSHLPQLLSTALAVTLSEQLQAPEHLRAGGPGLRDMTRLAASPFDIWRDIVATNQEPIRVALALCLETLKRLQSLLGTDGLATAFERAAAFARSIRDENTPPARRLTT